jgi:hypothetical protein
MRRPRTILAILIALVITINLALPLVSTAADSSASTDVRDWYDLRAVRDNLGSHYRLLNDLDAATAGYTETAGAAANAGRGWQPIGTASAPFTGTFSGQGHEIKDVVVDQPSLTGVGLFGYVAPGARIETIGVANASVTGNSYVGCLAGWNEGTLSNSYSSGTVTGEVSVGGLVGAASQGAVIGCHSSATVTGDGGIGGLVGWNDGAVRNSYATGRTNGNSSVGGLVGYNVGDQGGTISNSYSTGSVAGESRVGGLAGYSLRGTTKNSFWDTETSRVSTSDGGTGKTTAQMILITTFRDTVTDGLEQPWDIGAVDPGQTDDAHMWNIVDGVGLPFLSRKPLVQYSLTIHSLTGGRVTAPGEGVFPCDANIAINLAAEAEQGHRFTAWTGDIHTIADVTAAVTTVTMQDSYTIVANFEEAPSASLSPGLIAAIISLAAAGLIAFYFRFRRRPTPAKRQRRS